MRSARCAGTMPDCSDRLPLVPSHDPSEKRGCKPPTGSAFGRLLGNPNARRAESRRSVSRVPEFRRPADEPASAPHGARRSHDARATAA